MRKSGKEMTLNDLEKYRKIVPFFIFATCLLPWVVITFANPTEAKFVNEIIVPALAIVAGFFYVGLNIRGPYWKNEINAHVGKEIRGALLDMIPKDVQVTEDERRQLAQAEVFKELTGVFWEAIDRDPALVAHKQHFYSNGIIYSTSIDVYLIGSFSGFCYAVASLATSEEKLAYAGGAVIAIALACRILVTPQTRRRHLKLSREQLDLLQRNQRDFVSDRFREIVLGWRRAPPPRC